MPRLLVHVEGQTEETFVNEVLRPHLIEKGFESVSARLMGNARLRERRGGIRSWQSAKRDIVRHLQGDHGCCSTTIVDYYALPSGALGGWPGRKDAGNLPHGEKATSVEIAVRKDVSDAMGDAFNDERFVPFVAIHEFEGFLFSNCDAFSEAISRRDLKDKLQSIRDSFNTPEEINDSSTTAPSKRIVALMPEYQKPLHGNLAALAIGLNQIRQECPHFHSWLEKLEDLL